jgi:hypothetical protein
LLYSDFDGTSCFVAGYDSIFSDRESLKFPKLPACFVLKFRLPKGLTESSLAGSIPKIPLQFLPTQLIAKRGPEAARSFPLKPHQSQSENHFLYKTLVDNSIYLPSHTI